MWNKFDNEAIKHICKNCGSKSVKQTYSYFRRMLYNSPATFWCEILDDCAFYVANKGKNHVRLVAIAVREDMQGIGVGKKVVFRLLERLSGAGLSTLTFRTSIDEDAQYFWLKMGAKIMDVKGSDYEMQIKIVK